jgi:hypothetical protein
VRGQRYIYSVSARSSDSQKLTNLLTFHFKCWNPSNTKALMEVTKV